MGLMASMINSEEILSRRRKEREEFRQEEKKKAEVQKKRSNKKKRIKNIILLIILLLILFLPMIKINKITLENNVIYKEKDALKEINLNNYESIASLSVKKIHAITHNFESVNYKYNPFTQSMTIFVKDAIPVSHDSKNNYLANDGKIKMTNMKYPTPLLISIDKDETTKINEELESVPYEIIMQMKSIEYSDKKSNILLIKMIDGNDVYIYDNQISYKMLYYDQIKAILDENDKPPGNIYLYVGNYYEEK